jgi:hypothetical protein
VLAALGLLAFPAAVDGQTIFMGAGVDAAAIQPTVDAFRTALGTLNANVVGSFGSGRREINWDGVPDAFSEPALLPGNFFNTNSPRGVLLTTPGTGVAVSAKTGNPTATPTQFGDIDPTYPTSFEPFSPQRLFSAIGSNIVDVDFAVPGGAQGARTQGFGAVFSDVDLSDTTSLTFFDANDVSLGTFFAPAASGDAGFSFIGVVFPTAEVARVRITSGDRVLAPGSVTEDLVVMDDFIYGEPIAAIPEPGTTAMLLAGLVTGAWVVRRRQAAAKGRSSQ